MNARRPLADSAGLADSDELLTPSEAAFELHMSRATLERRRRLDPTFPVFVAITPRKLYVRRSALRRWFDQRELDARERRAELLAS